MGYEKVNTSDVFDPFAEEDDGPFWSNQRCHGCGGLRDQNESVFCLDCHVKGRRIGGKVGVSHNGQSKKKDSGRFGNLV